MALQKPGSFIYSHERRPFTYFGCEGITAFSEVDLYCPPFGSYRHQSSRYEYVQKSSIPMIPRTIAVSDHSGFNCAFLIFVYGNALNWHTTCDQGLT